MTTPLSFEPAHTAVLSMDLQSAIVSIYAGNDKDFLSRAASVLRSARLAKMTVVHVQVGFRPNLPEISSRNPLFSGIKNSDQHRKIFEGTAGAIHSDVTPEGDDIVVTKHRISAFAGTDLDMILRANDIDTLILFGIATSGVVLSTLLHAADADYRMAVIKDCCADLDQEIHTSLLARLIPRVATVLDASEFVAALNSKQHA